MSDDKNTSDVSLSPGLLVSRSPCLPVSLSFFHGSATVIENVPLARLTYRLRLHSPELARSIRPGQFLMIRLPSTTDPLLGRPFALYDTVLDAQGQAAAVDVVYLVVGKLTGKLSELRPGEGVEAWGPLGNGFPDLRGREHDGRVASGRGQAPVL